MPTYMDIHEIPGGVTPEEVAKAHAQDLEVQQKYGVEFRKYWVNEKAGKIFCFVDAPNAEAAHCVHREAHGMLAENIIEVQSDMAELFLGGMESNQAGAVLLPGSTDARDPGIRTILFTDIVDSTAMTQSIGDDAAMELLKVHDTIVRDALTAFSGREIKHTGDGIMASFVSSAGAVKCASEIQRELSKHPEKEGAPGPPIKVRIGAAAGEPVEHHDDLFGCTVQLAARLCSHALAGQILVTNAIADLCIGKGLTFHALGDVSLKGFDRPVQVHAVVWPGDAAAS
ncbi:MAG TPA: nickel-binding protein [Terriglobales bacterium]|nr:nickel-binding protein [Terriglobales bacterium]